MKALFNRFNKAPSKDKVKDPRDSDSVSPPASYHKKKLPQLPPLEEWPPPPPPLKRPQYSIGTPTSITSYEPLPELSSRPLPPIEEYLVPFIDYDPIFISPSRGPLSDVVEEDSVNTTVGIRTASPRVDQDSAGRSSRKTGNGSITTTNGSNDAPNKVAFLSPPPMPSGLIADRPLPEVASASNANTVVRSQPSHPKDPCDSMSTAASGSRPDVGSSKNGTQTVKDASTLSVTSPYSAKPAYRNGASIYQSPRSATPFSQKSIESVPPPASWTEGVEEDLVAHLVPCERKRQEVLWEFVASEERYATELLKMKDGFIIPLLHPDATSPVASPHQLPDNLRQCLEAIENRILAGHLKLSEGLRKRYDEQYPLVRSLTDVVIANSHILWGYADYIIHLERALEQANDVISMSNMTKRPKKDADEWLKVCTFLCELENDAQDRGETGLAISLSKPFQRLLKYPLLFQNLLFHTDPSTFEYESTLRMVAEVENIVRSIEDEKIQEEERAKTRDILARIEGLGKVKLLAAPEPSRVLVEERESSDASVETTQAVRGKKSFKRLSDVLRNNLGGVGGKKDLWLVVFNDVVLRCQRTGTTSLPLGSARASRANSVPELQGKSEVATTGWRNPTAQPRNLYKFIEIENWTPSNSVQPRGGVMSMEEAQIQPAVQQPRIVPMPDDDEDGGVDSDGSSDRKSKMSFCYWSADKKKPNSVQPHEGIKEVRSRTQIHSGVQPTPMPDDDSDDSDSDGSDRNKSKASKGSSYWSADKITLQNPIAKRRPGPGGQDTRRNGSNMPSGRSRELSMNAKFSHRLVSADSSAARPSSRRTVTPSGRRRAAPSDEGHSKKITATRPARGGSARTPASSVQSTMQSLNTSQNSAATRTTTAPPNKVLSEEDGVGLYRQVIANDPSLNKVISSPAPSEDSGVGLYRQMMANDLSQNND